jgi:hypothetical protein
MRFDPNEPILQLIFWKFLKVSPSHIEVVSLELVLMGYLYFEGLVHSLWHSGIVLRFLKGVTLAFEGLGGEGAKLDLTSTVTLVAD